MNNLVLKLAIFVPGSLNPLQIFLDVPIFFIIVILIDQQGLNHLYSYSVLVSYKSFLVLL